MELSQVLGIIQRVYGLSDSDLAVQWDISVSALRRRLRSVDSDPLKDAELVGTLNRWIQLPEHRRRCYIDPQLQALCRAPRVCREKLRTLWMNSVQTEENEFKAVLTRFFRLYALNQNEFAERCQITPSTLKNAYRGERLSPRTERNMTEALNHLLATQGIKPIRSDIHLFDCILEEPRLNQPVLSREVSSVKPRPVKLISKPSVILLLGVVVGSLVLFRLAPFSDPERTLVFDISGDWNPNRNPTDVWSFNGNNGRPLKYQFGSKRKLTPFVWGTATNRLDIPVWLRLADDLDEFDAQSGDVIMHGSDSGADSVSWTAPVDGIITIEGALWSPIRNSDHRRRDVVWALTLNGKEIVSDDLEGGYYTSADPYFLNRSLGRSGSLRGFPVRQGDRLILALERKGQDATFVGIRLTVTLESS